MLLLSTSSLKWYWLHKIFLLAKESNYAWIDLVLDKDNFDTLDAGYVKSLSDEFSIKVLSISAYDRCVEKPKIDKIIEMSKLLDSQIITFSPPHIKDKNVDFYIKYLNKVKKETLKTISIKNIEQKFMLFVIPEYKNANLLDVKSITWDTTLNIEAVDLSTWIDIIKSYEILWTTIKNVYLSDKDNEKTWLIPWNAWGGVSFLPIESLLMKLKMNWYSWFFSLNVKPKEIWVWNDSLVLENLSKVKKYYEKHFLNYK